jgi:hypothetical protein
MRLGRSRLPLWVAGLAMVLGGCGDVPCQSGSLFLSLSLDEAAATADRIELDVTLGGLHQHYQSARLPGAKHDSAEIDFGTYAQGQELVIEAVALRSGSPLARGRLAASLDPGCSSWQLSLAAAPPADAGVDDGAIPIDDGAMVEDAAVGDAAVRDGAVVDLSSARDLLPPRDFSVLPTVVFGSVTNTAEYSASSTATQFDDACPAHQALIGYDGYRDDGNGLVGQVIPLCGTVTVSAGGSGLTVQTTPGVTLPARGGTTNTACPRHCAPDQVVVGFTGRSGALVDQLIITCAPLTIDANSNFVVGATTNLAACGGTGGSAIPQTNCPSGQVATVSRTRISGFVEAFGLGCSKPTLQ